MGIEMDFEASFIGNRSRMGDDSHTLGVGRFVGKFSRTAKFSRVVLAGEAAEVLPAMECQIVRIVVVVRAAFGVVPGGAAGGDDVVSFKLPIDVSRKTIIIE